ncbi:serine protease DegP, putative [Plasmodium gallinaceum]|uniref:Serine protease DegP, putative n=1 Tax=Plasmodium gallinaceum TaxID=5849 RepID=A0A1J1H030_PLAGA|nr:serine protease DegP, putative [Plasmodium gallinaceum]CRG98089.1 serine protease DegP, putative [Plasmodium gallinaceum]
MKLHNIVFLFKVLIVTFLNFQNVDYNLSYLVNYIEKNECVGRKLHEFFQPLFLDNALDIEKVTFPTLQDEIEKLEDLKLKNYDNFMKLHRNNEEENVDEIEGNLDGLKNYNDEENNYAYEDDNNDIEYSRNNFKSINNITKDNIDQIENNENEIENYENEIENDEDKMENNENEIDNYENEVENNENEIDNYENEVENNENEIDNYENAVENNENEIENYEDEIENNKNEIENDEDEKYNDTEGDTNNSLSNNGEEENELKNNLNEVNELYNRKEKTELINEDEKLREKKKEIPVVTYTKKNDIEKGALNNNGVDILNLLKNKIKNDEKYNNNKLVNNSEKQNNNKLIKDSNINKKRNETKENTFTNVFNNKIKNDESYSIHKLDPGLNKLVFSHFNNPFFSNKGNSNKDTIDNPFVLKKVTFHPNLELKTKKNANVREILNLKENENSNHLDGNIDLFLGEKKNNRPKLKNKGNTINPIKQIIFDNSLINEKRNYEENKNRNGQIFQNNTKNKEEKLGKLKLINDQYEAKDIKNAFVSNFLKFIKKKLFHDNLIFKNKNNFKKFDEKENILEDEPDKYYVSIKQGNNPIFDDSKKNKENKFIRFLRFFPNYFNPYSTTNEIKVFNNKGKSDILKNDISRNNNKFKTNNISKNSIISEKLLENLKKIFVSNELNSQFNEKDKNNNIDIKGLEETDSLNKIFKGVVKLYVDVTRPNIEMLWQNNSPKHLTGSGFVIEGGLILTNAHNISYSTRILIRKHGNPKKYESEVIYVAHEADIAILVVQDKRFYKDIKPLELGSLPSLRDDVITVGYPSGGDKLSISKGIISRLDVQYYKHSNYKLLLTQIDAPMNPGNSGGPALVKGKVVGICFQSYKMGNSISYIIPTTIIKHFLLDIYKTNHYNGYAFLGVKFEPLENPHIRETLGLNNLEKKKAIKENIGILVTEVDENQMKYKKSDIDYCNYIKKNEKDNIDIKMTMKKQKLSEKIINYSNKEDKCYGLKINDVILSVDGKNINNDGTTKLRNDESVGFQYLFNDKFIDDLCVVKVVRNKEIKSVVVKLSKINYLISQHNWDIRNKYFIYGGLVFTTLSKNLYTENETDNPEINRLIQYNFFKKNEGDEIVILKNILPSKLTIGYYYSDCIVLKVKNIEVRNLKHLVDIVEDKNINKLENKNIGGSSYVKYENIEHVQPDKNLIDFYILTPNGEVPLVLNKEDVKKNQKEIFTLYNIINDRFLY